MSTTENIEDHMAKACNCGSVHFNLLKSGEIECAECQSRSGQWSNLKAGVYYCKECQALENIQAMPICDCGACDWIPSKQ